MMVETKFSEIEKHLTTDLLKDPYIIWNIKDRDVLYVSEQCNIMRRFESPIGLRVWIEAKDDNARELLRSLPKDKDISIEFGNPLGLKLVQEELDGVVKQNSIFCMVDRQRFHPSNIRQVSKLVQKDRDALQRYPKSLNKDVFLQFFDNNQATLYGCYEKDEIVGYGVVIPGNTINWVHVRPEFRGSGYGRSLITSCTMDLFRDHETVFYNACMDEMANLRFCLAVGCVPLRETFNYEIVSKRS